MSTATTVPRQAPRWQDLRAKAIDATFDADRRRVGERVALVFRWLFLIVLGALNHLNPATSSEAKVVIDVVLFAWAVMNVVVQVLLFPAASVAVSVMVVPSSAAASQQIVRKCGCCFIGIGRSIRIFVSPPLAFVRLSVYPPISLCTYKPVKGGLVSRSYFAGMSYCSS